MKSIKLIALGGTMVFAMACHQTDKSVSVTSDSSTVVIQHPDTMLTLENDKRHLKARLDNLVAETNTRMDTIDVKMQQASVKERKRLYSIRVRLEQSRNDLKGDLKEIDRKAEADWKKFKETVSAKADSLKKDL